MRRAANSTSSNLLGAGDGEEGKEKRQHCMHNLEWDLRFGEDERHGQDGDGNAGSWCWPILWRKGAVHCSAYFLSCRCFWINLLVMMYAPVTSLVGWGWNDNGIMWDVRVWLNIATNTFSNLTCLYRKFCLLHCVTLQQGTVSINTTSPLSGK